MVRGALYTYVRPEPTEEPELLGVSQKALEDIGLAESEAHSAELKEVVAGNKFYWTEEDGGIYPWAQCYGGWQFGSWAGQLGDGRAISLFESTNPETKVRYEIQLKGAGIPLLVVRGWKGRAAVQYPRIRRLRSIERIKETHHKSTVTNTLPQVHGGKRNDGTWSDRGAFRPVLA